MDSVTIDAITGLLNALGAIITALTGLFWAWRIRHGRFFRRTAGSGKPKRTRKLGPKHTKRKDVNGNEEPPQLQEFH